MILTGVRDITSLCNMRFAWCSPQIRLILDPSRVTICAHTCVCRLSCKKTCVILAFYIINKQTEKRGLKKIFLNKIGRQTLEGSKKKRETCAVK